MANGSIGTVPVEVLYRSPVSYVLLCINKQLIVEGQVNGTFFQVGLVKGDVHEEVIPEARSEILIIHPPLLKSESMCQKSSLAYCLRK